MRFSVAAVLIQLQVVHQAGASARSGPGSGSSCSSSACSARAVGFAERAEAARGVGTPRSSVPSISISSRPLERRGLDAAAVRDRLSSGLPYSLMSPSVDQVIEYFSMLFGCWGRAPTRSVTLVSSSKCVMSSLAAIEMKPGASPHCGTNGCRRALGRRAHGARDLDVLGQVEVVQAGRAGNLRDTRVAEIGQRRDDGIAGVSRQRASRGRPGRRRPRRVRTTFRLPCARTTARAASPLTSASWTS